MKEQVNQLFKVPHTTEGKLFLELARKYLNTDSYSLRVRGRTPNRDKLKKDKKKPFWCRFSVPLKYADNLGIYLMTKTPHNGKMKLDTLGIETINLVNYFRDECRRKTDCSDKLENIKQLLRQALAETHK